MQFSVRRGASGGSSGWAALARFTSRAFVLATLAGVAVLLFSGTASAKTCKAGCDDAPDTSSPTPLGSTVNTVNGLVQQPVRQLLGQRHEVTGTPSADAPAPVPVTQTALPTAAEGAAPQLAQQATEAGSTATIPAASPPSLGVAEPVVGTVLDTVEDVVPVADTVASPARDVLEGQPLHAAVDSTAVAIAELGAAAVPAVSATVRTVDATTKQLLDTAHVTTTTVLDSAQQVLATATGTLKPVTGSFTGALALVLGGPTSAGSAPSAAQAEPGSGVKPLGGATLGDTLPTVASASPARWRDLAAGPASTDGQVPTPPPELTSDKISTIDGDEITFVITGQSATPVPTSSGAGAAHGGGTAGPSATDLGKVFLDLTPAAPQTGFVPALHHSVHVPSAPVVEPAQSPD